MRRDSMFGIYGLPEYADDKIRALLEKKLPSQFNFKYPKTPYPTDEHTLQELQELISYVDTERVSNLEFIEMADADLLDCFKMLLSELGIEYRGEIQAEIDRIVEESSILIVKLKYSYNRPRPYQIAKLMDIEFEAIASNSAKTPSYPSGHTVQSLLVADYLSEIYPQYMDRFYALADKISYSRLWGGFHFKSDIDYGINIFYYIREKNEVHLHNKGDSMNSKNKIQKNMVCLSTSKLENGDVEYRLKGKARTWFALDKMKITQEEDKSSQQKTYSVVGIASSTSVDTYGTEMSIEALRSMSKQFNRGLPVLPRHSSILSTGIAEWDEVIGRTMEAEIKRTQVVNPGEEREIQYSLFVRSELYGDDPKAQDLIKRVNRGEPIGQSIGGWFEDVRVIENEKGDIQRIFVDDVTLDHVAITRAPSNPDSVDLMMMSIRTSIDNFNKDNIEYVRTESNVKSIDMDISKEKIIEPENKQERYHGSLDTEEEEKHEEGAVADDEDHVEYLEIDEAEDEADEGYRMKEEMERLKKENDRMKKELAALKEKAEGMGESDEDKDEKEDHDEGAVEDDEDHIEKLEEDEEEEKEDLKEEDKRSIGNIEIGRAAVPYQDLPKAPIDMKWSFSSNEGNEVLGDDDWAKYKRAHLWFDKNDAESKSGYKLPIAKIYNGKLSVFYRGIIAAMAALNGARGGVDIPSTDKKSIYNSIQKYYEKFGETAPALKVENSNLQDVEQNMDGEFDNNVQSLNYNDNGDTDTISYSMENPMTENDLQKLAEMITHSVRSALTPTKQEVKETRTPSREDPTEFEKLKSRLEKTEFMLNKYLETPVREGVHLPQVRAGIGAENEFTMMISRARNSGVVALSGVMERSVSEISEEHGPSKLTSMQVRDLLIKGLRAAQVDGLI